MKMMMIGAHPDDADLRAGGLAARYVEQGGQAMLVSVTNGNAGHQDMKPAALAAHAASEAGMSASGECLDENDRGPCGLRPSSISCHPRHGINSRRSG